MSKALLRNKTVAIVGLGQIGGSLALAFREKRLFKEIVGFDLDRKTLNLAQTRGLIDRASLSPEKAVAGADLILICIPVRKIVKLLPKIATLVKPSAVICETGSTKVEILKAVQKSKIKNFVGIHPVAGSEKPGISGWRQDLFRDKVFTITPSKQCPPESVMTTNEMVCRIGGKVVPVAAEQHDRMFAKTSHLPYLISIALTNLVFNYNSSPLIKGFLGGAFRDATRVAASSSAVMQDILFSNRKNIIRQINLFTTILKGYQKYLLQNNQESLAREISQARRLRSKLRFS